MRRQYPFHLIEPKWQGFWDQQQTFRAFNPGDELPASHPFAERHQLSGKAEATQLPPKFYILDMFPYPSGAGLHVGHPEGYTATDILARYRRAKGFNVLHPIGWDSFGLPAEQYAVRTGQHPRKTTDENIANFTKQIKSLGFSYDWSRELATTDPEYFKWTQWIFLKIYNSWFNPKTNKAEPIETLEYPADLQSASGVPPEDLETQRRTYRDSKRLAYVSEAPVWWCEQLGTVLANEEVVDGKSEVGGFPVVRKPMRQWMLRITAFAEKLLTDLDTIDWSDSLKEMQRNWIGRSEGAEVQFSVFSNQSSAPNRSITVFTTRPDTLFGATYMVLSPEHKLVNEITTPEQKDAVEQYKLAATNKSDLERTELAKDKTGVFTGAYAINPVNGEKIPIWIADYVLASYGTGAIMAVPAHDTRDFEFAQKFNLPVIQVVQPPEGKVWQGYTDDGVSVNSASAEISLNGLPTTEAKSKISSWLEEKGLGKKTINFKLRDWLFSRQRYWGEPFPIIWKRDSKGNLYHEALPEAELPLMPPSLTDYKPTASGEPPLARAKEWVALPDGSVRETNTMPQWAGSCWYYLRYTDAKNAAAFVGNEAEQYWMGTSAGSKVKVQGSKLGDAATATNVEPGTSNIELKSTPGVDLYVGGTEHAVLHLLYARFWHKVLFDLDFVSTPEPFFKLVNQGLILGEDGQKMSKSRGNVVNPDDILKEFGADAFRLYEMFMGPLEMTKPWNTQGVAGVYKFLGRVWRLFVDEKSETEFEQAETTAGTSDDLLKLIQLHPAIHDVEPTKEQLKALHACIKKVTEDLDGMRFNTAISAMMIFVSEALTWEKKPVSALRDFLQLLAPFSPHLSEELWARLQAQFDSGNTSLSYAAWPKFDAKWLVTDRIETPIQINGKLRGKVTTEVTATKEDIFTAAYMSPVTGSYLEEAEVVKEIVQPGKFANFIVKELGSTGEKYAYDFITENLHLTVEPAPASNLGYDLVVPTQNLFIEVKATPRDDVTQMIGLRLSATQFQKAREAVQGNAQFEVHLLSGVSTENKPISGYYAIPADFIVQNAEESSSGWMLPISGEIFQFQKLDSEE